MSSRVFIFKTWKLVECKKNQSDRRKLSGNLYSLLHLAFDTKRTGNCCQNPASVNWTRLLWNDNFQKRTYQSERETTNIFINIHHLRFYLDWWLSKKKYFIVTTKHKSWTGSPTCQERQFPISCNNCQLFTSVTQTAWLSGMLHDSIFLHKSIHFLGLFFDTLLSHMWMCFKNIARNANAVQVTLRLLYH